LNIAIYNLYLATFGGGERRTAALAAHLAKTHRVTLFGDTVIDVPCPTIASSPAEAPFSVAIATTFCRSGLRINAFLLSVLMATALGFAPTLTAIAEIAVSLAVSINWKPPG